MTRSQRMKRIVSLADSLTRVAAQRLASSRHERDGSRAKLQQFEGYRDEYLVRLGAGQTAMSAAQARELRQFIGQVESAITALKAQDVAAGLKYREDMAEWSRKAKRTRALGEVEQRARRSDDHALECRAQREVDDRFGKTVADD